MRSNKPRFDLFAIVEWTAAIAFICALLAGSAGTTAWTTHFKSLPPDDSNLLAWLEQQERRDVKVTREGNSISLEMKTGVLAGILARIGDLPSPPWEELGYPVPQGMGGSTSWTLFSGSAYLWIVGFGILFLLGYLRRWIAKSDANVVAPKEDHG